MTDQNESKTFENFESRFFSFELVLSSDNTDPDKNVFNDKPCFSAEHFIALFKQLNKDNFSILHLNIRSLNVNIDNFREFSSSLKGNFSVIYYTCEILMR